MNTKRFIRRIIWKHILNIVIFTFAILIALSFLSFVAFGLETIDLEVDGIVYFSCFGHQKMVIEPIDYKTSTAHCENYPAKGDADEATDDFDYFIITDSFYVTMACKPDPLGRDVPLNAWNLSTKTGIAECKQPDLFQLALPILGGK